ncbi:peroxisomal membrane protein PEX14 isoform X2 [Ctenocephalides felis]|uniref:peroxisomal membrane protein PEX14 isoform X2 n=1 Tax=Ctenocephalides felis TaxID=7515 RepID=UPI000E6E3C5E|nr:peroxisomal membrane protein PEX14 isoform X2 [Ctenocephalides felis]
MTQEEQKEVTVTEIREDIVQTAVKFLQNPNVQRSAITQKQQFLRSKGLSEDEIQAACERAGAFNILPTIPPNPSPITTISAGQSRLSKIRDILGSLALFGSLAYAIYMLYKRFIEPYLFVKSPKKRKTVEENINELAEVVHNNIKEMKENVSQIKLDVSKISQPDNYTFNQQIIDIKSEIGSLKSLLLSRKQFPSISTVVPPSIPAWQLTSAQQTHTDHDIANDNDCHKAEDLLDSGSGSGSSETDVVTKNSDSSLEIM